MESQSQERKVIYMCAEDGYEYTHYCLQCSTALCMACLPRHGSHGCAIELLSVVMEKENRECSQYSQDLDSLIRVAKEMSNEVNMIGEKTEKVREENAKKLDGYVCEIQKGLKEREEAILEVLKTEKESCFQILSQASASIEDEQKQLVNSRKRKSKVLSNVSKIISNCNATGISHIKTSSIETSLKDHFPKIKQKESNIYDRTMLFSSKPTAMNIEKPPEVPSSRRPTIITSDEEHSPIITSLATSSTLTCTLHPNLSQSTNFCPIPIKHALIASIIPKAHNKDVHMSSVCCTGKGDIFLVDCRNSSIHKLTQSMTLAIKDTTVCSKTPHLLATFNNKIYILEKSPGYGFCLRIKGFIDSHNHIQVDAPNGLAVGLSANRKLQVVVTDSVQEPGEFQSKIVIFNANGEYRGEILEKHSHIKVPFGIAYGYGDTESAEPYVVVTDIKSGCLAKITLTGKHLWNHSAQARQLGILNKPYGVAIFRSGVIAVSEQESHQIALFSFDGYLIKRIGMEGEHDGTFRKPQSIATTPNDDLIVIDSGNEKVQVIPWESFQIQ